MTTGSDLAPHFDAIFPATVYDFTDARVTQTADTSDDVFDVTFHYEPTDFTISFAT